MTSSLLFDLVREGLAHLRKSPLRFVLGALTSAVAIGVTVNVISLTQGLDEDLRADALRFGPRTVDVLRLPVLSPGMRTGRLVEADVERVEGLVEGLPVAAVVARRHTAARSLPEDVPTQVVAAGEGYLETLDVGIATGRWLRRDDPDGREGPGVCVLDAQAVAELLPGVRAEEAPGRRLRLLVEGGERAYEVVGVLSDPLSQRGLFETFDSVRGVRTMTSALLSFRNVYVPATALGGEDLAAISVVARSDADVERVRERLLTAWPARGDDLAALAGAGVGVFVRRDWMQALGGSTQAGALVGNIVWMLVVVVAGVMITTLGLLTVRERYDEIAIRRCEGARRRDVALQIAAEGTATAFVGGGLGLLLGRWGSGVLREVSGIPFRFDAGAAVYAVGVALVLGLVSALLPARRAARLDPARVLGRRIT
jgi:putative ABC transport system permease protein